MPTAPRPRALALCSPANMAQAPRAAVLCNEMPSLERTHVLPSPASSRSPSSGCRCCSRCGTRNSPSAPFSAAWAGTASGTARHCCCGIPGAARSPPECGQPRRRCCRRRCRDGQGFDVVVQRLRCSSRCGQLRSDAPGQRPQASTRPRREGQAGTNPAGYDLSHATSSGPSRVALSSSSDCATKASRSRITTTPVFLNRCAIFCTNSNVTPLSSQAPMNRK